MHTNTGTVFAAQAPPPPPPPPPSDDFVPEMARDANEKLKKLNARPNPGQYDFLSNEPKRVLSPDIFDGCRFDFSKPLSPSFATSHR